MAEQKNATLDLTPLMEDRVHLTGFECSAIRALRQLQAVFFAPFYNGPRVEFWQKSNTNPKRVTCVCCFSENPQVRATHQARIVIDLRPHRRKATADATEEG